jgi:hypothetical protein
MFEWLSPPDRVLGTRFRKAIEVLLSMHRRMTTTQAITFLQVAAAEEELTVSALADNRVQQHCLRCDLSGRH